MVGFHLHRAFPACIDHAGPTLFGSRTVSWFLLLPNAALTCGTQLAGPKAMQASDIGV